METNQLRDEKLVIYPGLSKLITLTFLGFIMTALSSIILFIGVINKISGIESSERTMFIIIGVIGTLFFGLCLIYIISRLFVKKPSLIIDENGIYDNASAVGVGLIKWDEIREVFIYDFMGQRFLGIVPIDSKKVLSRCGPFKRFIMNINKGMVRAPINIPQNALKISLEEIKSKIDTFWRTMK